MLGTALLLTVLAACGNSTDRRASGLYTADMVRDAFAQETGDELIVEKEADDVPVMGDVTLLGVRSELDAKYGDFGITVYRSLGNRARDLLAGDKRSEGSIDWEYLPTESPQEPSYWTASKWQGNVVLTWFHESKETNEQWERLDRVMRRLEFNRQNRSE